MDEPRRSGPVLGSAPGREPQKSREVRSLSPEARRLARIQQFTDREGPHSPEPEASEETWRERCAQAVKPGSRAFEVVRRTVLGTYRDGFIHAGNLAYLSLLAIFPFFILAGALFQLVGELEERRMIVETVVLSMPPTVQRVIAPVAESVIGARSGWFLWFGAAAGLWSVSSLIETIRDVLRRAYGTRAVLAFWRYRLASAGLIIGAVVLLLLSLFAQVGIGAAQQFILAWLPDLGEATGSLSGSVSESLGLSRFVPAFGLFGSLYLLFWALAPEEYSARIYPKWPGAVFTTVWWLAVSTAMPPILSGFFVYDLTYGSMAGIIIALLFFWLVGLGVVIGAELNAALAEPEWADTEADPQGQFSDRSLSMSAKQDK
ncbi:MAG: YihY/virulence factor BrkB family protein [Pseudomonadota bacterium]